MTKTNTTYCLTVIVGVLFLYRSLLLSQVSLALEHEPCNQVVRHSTAPRQQPVMTAAFYGKHCLS